MLFHINLIELFYKIIMINKFEFERKGMCFFRNPPNRSARKGRVRSNAQISYFDRQDVTARDSKASILLLLPEIRVNCNKRSDI